MWELLWLPVALLLGITNLLLPGIYFLSTEPFGEVESQTHPIFCYFVFDIAWPNNGTLHPALNSTLCTHVLFLGSTIKDSQVSLPSEDIVDKYLTKVPLLRQINPGVKVIISSGGNFDDVLTSSFNRTKFSKSALNFLKTYTLDGFDFDWEFPGWNGHPRAQRANFTTLLQEVRDIFDEELKTTGRKYTLSAAVAAGRSVMTIYDVPALAKSLDYLNMMGYDYHGYSPIDPITGYDSPLYPNDWWKRIILLSGNIGWSANEYVKRGMPKSKIMIGVPTYAKTWTLLEPDKYHGVDAPAKGPGRGAKEIQYQQMCAILSSPGAKSVFDEDAAVPYAYKGDQWYSYENTKSLRIKAQWTLENGYAGVMVYSLNNDDYLGRCGQGKLPLISAIKSTFREKKMEGAYIKKDIEDLKKRHYPVL